MCCQIIAGLFVTGGLPDEWTGRSSTSLSLVGVTTQEIRLFIVCTVCDIYGIYNAHRTPRQSKLCRTGYAVCHILFYKTSSVI